MNFKTTHIPYRATGVFTPLVNDYIESKGTAQSFVDYTPDIEGVKKAIAQRKKFPTNRKVLVQVLQKQYEQLAAQSKSNHSIVYDAVHANVKLLEQENTFVVTTAHQPNLFTGPLYFFYKIIQAIQLAADYKKQFPEYNFVPVYYMGSEDADIDEVGSFNLGTVSQHWKTKQTGAIGRMKVDDALLQLLQNIEGYWAVKPAGKEALDILKQAYQKGNTIIEATLYLVHAYFGKYGLVVVQPDDVNLKSLFTKIMEQELTTQFSHQAIQPTLAKLKAEYHVQSEGRPINLFYLKEGIRARIEKQGEQFIIVDTNITFTQEQIIDELNHYPERFSPNVILRGLYQETILPGIVFVGGGGELAYWMELKTVFKTAAVHYPVLLLRNSFLFIKEKQSSQWDLLGFELTDLFKPTLDLEVEYVKKQSNQNLDLTAHIASLNKLYSAIQEDVIKIDASLGDHALNLSIQAQKKLALLEKKMIRAEKRKQHTSISRIHNIKGELFPTNNLQERVENFAEWVGEYGWDWVDVMMENSTKTKANFSIINIEKSAL
jgi:bacillithiol biosynthesis cysteine-adding enzyme BshC